MLAILFALLVTLLLVTINIDQRIGARKGARWAYQPPNWPVLVAITVTFNIAVLPYHFYQTRRSVLAAVGGFGLYIVCVAVALAITLGIAAIAR